MSFILNSLKDRTTVDTGTSVNEDKPEPLVTQLKGLGVGIIGQRYKDR